MGKLKNLADELVEWRMEVEGEQRSISRRHKDLFAFFKKQILSELTSGQDEAFEGKVWVEAKRMFDDFVVTGELDQFTQRHLRAIASRWSEFDGPSFRSLLSKSSTLQRYWLKRFLRTYPEAMIPIVRDLGLGNALDQDNVAGFLLKGMDLGDHGLPLVAIKEHGIKIGDFTDPDQGVRHRWLRYGDEFTRSALGAKILDVARGGNEKALTGIFQFMDSQEGEHLRFTDLRSLRDGTPIKLSQKWWVIALLGIFAHSKEHRGKALRLLAGLGRTELGDPRGRLNRRNWEFIQGIVSNELKQYIASLNSADLDFFFDLPEVDMKEARAEFWRPYISKAEWTHVVFDRATLLEVRGSYRSEEHQAIIERASVFRSSSKHHAIVMGFSEVVVIEGHTTNAKAYLIGRDYFDRKYGDQIVSSGVGVVSGSGNAIVNVGSFEQLKSSLNADPNVIGISHIKGWERKARENLRNLYRLVKER